MASTSNQRASSLVSSTPSSSTAQWTYDVFLSFRGEDTRNKFTDHLYAALNQRGIVVFRDDKKLERGKAIAPELLKAIAESRISIVVFSRNYASSTWCLDELVQIVECMGKKGQVVLPIFYDVNPSEVRKQTGSFQEDFAKHEQVFGENIKKVEEWRTAMTEVANLSGWNIQDRSEAKLIQDIVKEIWCKLICTFPSVVDGLVGIDSRLMELNTYLGEGLNEVRFIGICGMGGIGKTTIARVVHEILSRQFESRCFLVNVKEVFEKQGLVPLQNQLLSKVLKEPNINVLNVFEGVDMIKSRLRYRKVLLILDDVDNLEQLKMLAGDHDWFGPGSRIIITTRDQHLLSVHGVDGIYKATELNYNDSLNLFSSKAFKQNHPAKDYEELSMRAINYASGLPLVLEVLGSNLCGQSVTVWESYLDKLDQIPDKDILNKLKVSFDSLDKLEKKIFLDIACFFKRCDRDHVTKILDACGFFSCCGIQKLIDKSLIKMIKNELWMHDQLQYMGVEIVYQECTEEPGKRSRLWAAKDVNHVLTKNMGTDAIETMVIDLPERIKAQWKADYFSKMSKLRLLKIHNVDLKEGPKYLSNELRCLEWHGYPSTCLPSTFHLDKLVELHMCYSGIKQLWKGKEALENLKFITLSHSQNLIKTPDFTGIPNLERLILEGCTRLREVHRSIGLLRKLILLNLKDCKSLGSLPSSIYGLKSLKSLILSGCCKLQNLPENLGEVECLEELDVSGTALRQPPSTIVLLKNLKVLSFRGCKATPCNSWHLQLPFLSMKIKKPMPLMLPSLSGLCSLTNLNLRDCNLGDGDIPNDIGCLSTLKILNLSGNNLVSLPTSINRLSRLFELNVENCKRLQSLPELSSDQVVVEANDCVSLEMLPDPLKQCSTEELEFPWLQFYCVNCIKLVENQGCSSMATRMLKRYLQVAANRRRNFEIVIPENKIPEWFRYQTEGSNITLQSSLHLNKWTSFVVCSTFVGDQHSPGQGENKFPSGYNALLCLAHADYKVYIPTSNFRFKNKLGQVVPDHLWLFYMARKHFPSRFSEFDKASHFGFSVGSNNPYLKFKKMGVHPIYEQDVGISTFENFIDLLQDFDGSTTLDGAMIKRINDEAGPSGSDCFKDEPHPKLFKY